MTKITINCEKHDINFDITLSGNIKKMKNDDVVREVRSEFEKHLHNQCEYMTDLSLSESNHEDIELIVNRSNCIIEELMKDKASFFGNPALANKTHQEHLAHYIMYELKDGRIESTDLAEDFVYTAFVDDDDDNELHEFIDDDLFHEIRDAVVEVIEADWERNIALGDLINNERQRTEFIYLPNFNVDGLAVVDDHAIEFSTNYSSVSTMILDESAERFFTMINMNPADFADYLESIDANDEVVSKYRDLKNVPYSKDREPLLTPEQVVTVIDNAQTYPYPVVYGNVSLFNLLDRDITRGFILKNPLVGLHGFLNGSGYLEQANNFTIEPEDLCFVAGKPYRYTVDEVYGFSSDYKNIEITQPVLTATYHADAGEKKLLEIINDSGKSELQTKSILEKESWGRPDLFDKENGHLLRDDGGFWHIKPLNVDDSRVLCAIYDESERLKKATSSKELNSIISSLGNIESKFSINCARLRHLGLIESWDVGGKSHLEPTYIGKFFYRYESPRLAELAKDASWFEMK